LSPKPYRRRNAGLTQRFRKPVVSIESPPPRKLWPESRAEDAIEWWRRQREKPLFVYFIQDVNGPVKIGKAYDPNARLAELQCGNPQPLTLRSVVLAASDTEYRLHVAWVGYRIHGEWFRDETRLIELARRAQREQIAAFKRGDDETDILAMPVDRITPTARVRANLLVSL
jgi:hypothetical protein